jgi:hypothetical protein
MSGHFGYRMETQVPIGKPDFQGILREIMAMSQLRKSDRVMRVKGRSNRCQSVGTKVTVEEEAALIHSASSEGKFLSEWARETLLRAAEERSYSADVLMSEVQALRLILINTLEVLLRGDKMTSEQFKEMLRYVKSNKRKAAADMFASYAEGSTEQP